jgi:NhaC family Na+:H+ antiporter
LVAFLVVGLNEDAGDASDAVSRARAAIESVFNVNVLALLPLAVLLVVALRRLPAFLSILGVALFSGVLAAFTQPDVVKAFVDEPGQNYFRTSVEAIYAAMATGFVSTSGNEAIDSLFSRGGMSSMLTTVWLILGALSFAAVMEQAGFLDRLIRPVVERASSAAQLILTVAATAVGLNVLAGDQYIAIVMPSRIFRVEFAERGLAPRMLSRTVEDTGTVTSPLIPWNSCGAYMTGVLGVPTLSYAPWALFNIFNPLIAIGYAITGFKVERVERPPAPEG